MSCMACRSAGLSTTTMKNTTHDIFYGWTDAPQDASGVLRDVAAGRMAALSLRDMVNI